MKKDLKTLSLEELLERYNEVALLMGYDSDNLLTRSYTRRFKEKQRIVDEFWARSAIDALLPGIRHENPWIRYFSAANCGEIAPAETEAVLEELARIPYGTVGSQARTALYIIRSGIAVSRRPPQAPKG